MGSSSPPPSELGIEILTESDECEPTAGGVGAPPESSVCQAPTSGSSFSLVKITSSNKNNFDKGDDAESVRSFTSSISRAKSERGFALHSTNRRDDAASVRSFKSAGAGRLNAKFGGSSSNVFKTLEERSDEYLWPIYVGNVPEDSADELRGIFCEFGEFAPPDVAIYSIHPKLAEFYALVNFKSFDSMERALAYDKPIFVQGNRSDVKPAKDSGLLNLHAEKPYTIVLVTDVSEDMSREDLLDMFGEFGKIADPPSVKVYKDKREATIPYRFKHCAEKLLRVTNGRFYVSRWCTLHLSLLDPTPEDHHSSFESERILSASLQDFDAAIPKKIAKSKKRPNVVAAEIVSDTESHSGSDETMSNGQAPQAAEPKEFETYEPLNRHPSAQKLVDLENVLTFLKNDQHFKEIIKAIMMENALTCTANKSPPVNGNVLQIRLFSGQKLTSGDVLRMYLKNSHRSQGGEIVEFEYDQSSSRATVEFTDRFVATGVLSKPDGHTLENCTLFVTELPPVQPKCFFLANVPANVSKYNFENYLGARFLCSVESVVFRPDNSAALVTLAKENDFGQLRADLREKPYRYGEEGEKSAVLDIAQVRYPDAVVVHGSVPSEDSLRLTLEDYLEMEIKNKEKSADVSSKSDAGSISNLVRYIVPIVKSTSKSSDPESPSSTLVIFEDYRAVRLLKDHVTLDGQPYKLTSYYDCLGFSFETDAAIGNHGESKIIRSLTQLQTSYFRVEANLHKLRQRISASNWRCHLQVNSEENELIIATADKEEGSIIEQFIFANLHTLNQQLNPSMQKSIDDNKTTIFDIEMEKSEACYQITNVDQLEIVSFTTDIDRLKSIVDDFFQTYAFNEICVTKSNLEALYLQKYHAVDLQMESLVKHVEFQEDSEGCTKLNVIASQKNFLIFRKMIDLLLKDTDTIEYIVKRPGMSKYLRDSPNDLNSIMESTRTLISLGCEATTGLIGDNERPNAEIRPETVVEEPLTLYVYGSKQSVRYAQVLLDALCEEKCSERTVLNNVIGNLTEEQLVILKSDAAKMRVDLEIDRVQKKAKICGVEAVKFCEHMSDYLSTLSDVPFLESSDDYDSD